MQRLVLAMWLFGFYFGCNFFCCDQWLSFVWGRDIGRIQNSMVSSGGILSMWQLVQTGGSL